MYYKKIDGLRFVAIFFVLIEHFANYLGRRFHAGYYGVDLFFVISGFLITLILLKQNNKHFWHAYGNFIGRRTLRIFPVYYATIFILYILNLEEVKNNLAYLLTYTYNYASVIKEIPVNPISHFWSLGVEEQFYLFWPFIVLVLNRRIKILQYIILLIIIVGFGQLTFNIFPSISEFNYKGLLTRMGSLGIGSLGAIMQKTNSIPYNFLKNKKIEFFIFLSLSITLFYEYPGKYFILAMCSLYLVIKSANVDFNFKIINRLLENKYVVFIGTISYGIYVIHKPIAYYFQLYVFDPLWNKIDFQSLGVFSIIQWHSWLIKFPLYSAITIFFAALSFRYFETPLLKLKDKFFRY